MPETADLTPSALRHFLAEAETERAQFAHKAFLLEKRCRGLRDDNPNDPRLRDLSVRIDALDEQHDRLSDEIGRLKGELYEIDSAHARLCLCRGLNPSEY